MGFVEDAKKIKGPMLNGNAEQIVEAIELLNSMFNYMDLVGVFPSDHDSRDCWTLVFIGECDEGIITVDVGTHEGVFRVEEPRVWAGGEGIEAARTGFRALRSEYERVWKEQPEKARRVARFLDSLNRRDRNTCPECVRPAPGKPEATTLPIFPRQPLSPPVDHAFIAAKAGDPD